MNIIKLKEAFIASGKSRNQIAREANVNLSTISRLLSGKDLNVGGDAIKKIEKVLNLKKGDLL